MNTASRMGRGGRVLVQMNGSGLGGSEINAVQFAAAVREHGFESVLVAPVDPVRRGPTIHDVAAQYGVEVSQFERPTSALGAARLFDRLASEARADLVHVYGQGAMRGAYLGPCRLAQRPLVQTAYEMTIGPHNLDGPELVVGTRYLLEECAHREGPTTLISPPVDLDRDVAGAADRERFRASYGISPDDRAIVWVGRLDNEMKAPAVRTLIDAVAVMSDPRVRLVIVGGGTAEPALRTRADEVNVWLGREAVLFAGAVADPRPAYAAADVSVGMGGSAARALAFALPLVVVGETGWSRPFAPESAAELFRDSFWSAEVQPDAVQLLARHIAAILADPVAADRVGAFGRRFAEEQFGLAAMGARLAEVYTRARISYTRRAWLHDLHRERRAAVHVVRRRLGRRVADVGVGEYRYPL